tara:strand:- start:107 stop:334 length:228 start_codon:yes stop_codon:yes gene_type:complete
VHIEKNEYDQIIKYTEALSREELKATIDYWEDEAKNLVHEEIQHIAMIELTKRNNERDDQINSLNQSLLVTTKIG